MKYKCALVFGTFDALHFGHIRLFKRAKNIAEKVFACTESDEIIRINKKREPFTTENERVEDLKSIKYLEDVFMRTGERNRDFYVQKVKPDILILGDDWKYKKWAGETLGIKIIYLPRTLEISSTLLKEKYANRNL